MIRVVINSKHTALSEIVSADTGQVFKGVRSFKITVDPNDIDHKPVLTLELIDFELVLENDD